MKSILFLAMLVIGFASCDTPSTASGTETQTDTAAVNTMDNTTTTTVAPDTSAMQTDTSMVKKDTTTTTP